MITYKPKRFYGTTREIERHMVIEDNITTLDSMFKTLEVIYLGSSVNASVDVDEFISYPNSFFAGNSFDSLDEFKDVICKMRENGATNIKVTGLPINYGWSESQIKDEIHGDTLLFNAPDENVDILVKIAEPDTRGNYQHETDEHFEDLRGKIRFWWD